MPYFTHNQKRLHYIEQGQGPLLVILPGNTASSAHHQGELDFFSGLGYHAVSLDFHGTGQSDRIAGPWPLDWFEQNAHDCAALIKHLGGESTVVTGTSGGAIVAVLTAIHYPTLVRALIADSAGRFYPPEFFEQCIQADRGQRTSG